jgi:hypothetical protein
MTDPPVVVRIGRDEEAGDWCVVSSNLPRVNAEAATVRALFKKLPGLIVDLAEEGVTGDPRGSS